jgi:hypothetical protein
LSLKGFQNLCGNWAPRPRGGEYLVIELGRLFLPLLKFLRYLHRRFD